MKVIKKQDTTQWSHKHTCDKCDSELEVEPKDLRHKHYDGDFRDPAYDVYLAQCPVCADEFTISSKRIPKLIQIEAQERTARRTTGYFDR